MKYLRFCEEKQGQSSRRVIRACPDYAVSDVLLSSSRVSRSGLTWRAIRGRSRPNPLAGRAEESSHGGNCFPNLCQNPSVAEIFTFRK
jgi:hypothetical protein